MHVSFGYCFILRPFHLEKCALESVLMDLKKKEQVINYVFPETVNSDAV